ncbi:hypothetical protein EDB83DRAFT_2322456 [Lactarius deliciosus]|nr:hypothetical protein EDB83DRAFT_2322456 [Lactarius deliciosus]
MSDAGSGFTAMTDNRVYGDGSDVIKSQNRHASGGVSKLAQRRAYAAAAEAVPMMHRNLRSLRIDSVLQPRISVPRYRASGLEVVAGCRTGSLWRSSLPVVLIVVPPVEMVQGRQSFHTSPCSGPLQPEPQSPVQGQNGKNPSARSSMGPAARPSEPQRRASRAPSELLGSATFQTPEADAIDQWFETFHHYEVTLEGMDAASLDVNFKEELSAIEQLQIRFFVTVLQQMARADPMTALLSSAVGGSMNLKSPGLKSTMPGSPSARTLNTSATNRQSLAFDSSSSFLSPDAANTVDNPSDAHSPNSALNSMPHIVFLRRRSPRAEIVGLGLGSQPSRGAGQLHTRDIHGAQAVPSAEYRLLWPFRWLCLPLPARRWRHRSRWASMVNTPLLPMFQKSSSNNSNNGQTVDLAAANLNDLYGSSNVPRLDGPDKFRRPSKGHIHDGSSGSNKGATMLLVLVQSGSSRGLRNGGGGTWSGGQSPALSNSSGRFGGSDDGSNAMAAAHQQQFNLGLGSPGLTGMPNGLYMAQLAQLNGMNGMNPFNMNMNMLNLAAMGVSPEAQLLAAQIAAAGGGFGQPGLGVGAGLGTFGGMQGGMSSNGPSGGSGRSGGRSPRLGGDGSASDRGGSAGNGGAKKDEEDFEPSVLNDVAGWLRTLRLHKYTPNFEGMTWKEMVVMDEQALEAQGVAALGARRKMLKTFEVVRKKMGIDDPTAPPPPSSGGSAPGAPGSSGGSAGSGGGLSA